MKQNVNITSVPEIEAIEHAKKRSGDAKDIIRQEGRIVYFSSSALGFDLVTQYPNNYLHDMPDGVEGYLLLPLWHENKNRLI